MHDSMTLISTLAAAFGLALVLGLAQIGEFSFILLGLGRA